MRGPHNRMRVRGKEGSGEMVYPSTGKSWNVRKGARMQLVRMRDDVGRFGSQVRERSSGNRGKRQKGEQRKVVLSFVRGNDVFVSTDGKSVLFPVEGAGPLRHPLRCRRPCKLLLPS